MRLIQELIKEETREIKRNFYHSPLPRKKQRVESKPERPGKVKFYSEEEILSYQKEALR